MALKFWESKKQNNKSDSNISKLKTSPPETALEPNLPKPKVRWGTQLKALLLGKKQLDYDILEEIETLLLNADLGIEVTQNLIATIEETTTKKELANIDTIINKLKNTMLNMLQVNQRNFQVTDQSPFIVLVVGVNGVGKTTSIGKLSYRLKQQGHSVLLAAGDTFRAAASEQLQHWGNNHSIDVIYQGEGADSAAVIYDAITSANARQHNVVIADTAGRLHNKSHLMDELSKIKRVIGKADDSAPHEVLLVVDASTGQNAIHQAREFGKAVNVSGLILTKMDGTAKGGILLALVNTFKLPIFFIGTGEKMTDLVPFDAQQYIDSIF